MKSFLKVILLLVAVIALFILPKQNIIQAKEKTYTVSSVSYLPPWRFSKGGVYVQTKEGRDIFLDYSDVKCKNLNVGGKINACVGICVLGECIGI